MVKHFPEDEQSEAAAEGEAAHELAERMITAITRNGIGFPDRSDTIGTTATNGVVIDAEMYMGAHLYAGHLSTLIRSTLVFGGAHIGVEKRVANPYIHLKFYGFVDFYLYARDNNTLHIYDFKYGKGTVEVFENWQLICYAIMVMYGLRIQDLGSLRVSMNVVQPRSYHRDGTIRNWTVAASDLTPFFAQLKAGADRAFMPDAPTHTGPHCRYCLALNSCPAAVKAGSQMVEVFEKAIPLEMSVGELAHAFTLATRGKELLTALCTGFETEIKAQALRGVPIPGYIPEPTFGRERWTKPYADTLAMGALMEVDLRQEKLITPNQARDLGVNPDVVKAFTERPAHGVKLVHDDNKKLRKVFSS